MSARYKIDRVENATGVHVYSEVELVSDALLFPGEGMHVCFYLEVKPEHVVFLDGAWPEALNAAVIGKRGCEVIDHPVFAGGTVAGEAVVVQARSADELVEQHGYDDSWKNMQVLAFDRPIVPIEREAA